MTLPDQSQLDANRSPLLFALLLLLALHEDKALSRETVMDFLWREGTAHARRLRLRVQLSALRKRKVPFTERSDDLVAFDPSLEIHLDDRATTGELFAKWDGSAVSAPFAEWLADERTRQLVRVLEPRARALQAARATGKHTDVVDAAQAVLAVDPLNQEGIIAKADALIYTGSKADALEFVRSKDIDLEDNQWTGPAWEGLKRRLRAVAPRPGVAEREAPFVGRDGLLSELSRIFTAEQHDARHAGVVLTGLSGMGKSTVCAAAIEHATRVGGRRTITVRCLESEQLQPLALLFRLVAQLLETPGAAGASPDSFGLLRDMRAGHSWLGNDRRAEEAFLKASCIDMLSAICAEHRLLIAVDDAQWIDTSSLDVLRGLIELATAERVGWLIAQRPTTISWPHALDRHEVGPLDAHSARALYRAWRGTDPATPAERSAITAAGGHPLWLRALAQGAAHDRNLAAGTSVVELLAREISHFDTDVVDLLQYVTLLGPLATVARLAQLFASRPPKALQQALRFAQGQELLVDDGGVVVVHDLWRQAVLEHLPSLERTAAHLEVLELLLADPLDTADDTPRLWGILEHAKASGALARAARAAILLGDRWCQSGCSAKQFAALIEIAEARDIHPADYQQLVERTAMLLHQRTDHVQMLAHSDAVLERLSRLGRHSLLVKCLVDLSRLFVSGEHSGEALGPLLDAVVSDEAYPEFTRLALLNAGLRVQSNDPRQNHGDPTILCSVLDGLLTQRHTVLYAETMMLAGVNFFNRTRALEGMSALERFVAEDPSNLPPAFTLRTHRWLGLAHHHIGEPHLALPNLAHSIELAARLEEPHATEAIAVALDHVCGQFVHAGHFAQASTVLDRLVRRMQARGHGTWRDLPKAGERPRSTHGWEPGLAVLLWDNDVDLVEQQLAAHYPDNRLWREPAVTDSPLYLAAHVGYGAAAAVLGQHETDAMRTIVRYWCTCWTTWMCEGRGLNREGVYYSLATGALALGMEEEGTQLLDALLTSRGGLPTSFPFAELRARAPLGLDAVAFTYGKDRPTRPFASVFGMPDIPAVILAVADVPAVTPEDASAAR